MHNWTKIISLIASIVVFAVALIACSTFIDDDRTNDAGHINIDAYDDTRMNGEVDSTEPEINDYASNNTIFGRWRYERILPCGEGIAIEWMFYDTEWDHYADLTVFVLDENGMWIRRVRHSFEWEIQGNRLVKFIPQFHDAGYEERLFRIFGDTLIIYDGGMFSYIDGPVSSGTESFHDADWSGEVLIFVRVP